MTYGLIYHDVLRSPARISGFRSADADTYKLSLDRFSRQIEAMLAAKIIFSRVDGSAAGDSSEGDSVLLTFDDGGASMADEVVEILGAAGINGHFFIVTDLIGTPGFLSARNVRALHAAGHVVGSHSCTHPERISALNLSSLLREWRDSRAALEQMLGAPVRTASVPGGYLSNPVTEAVRASGYTVLHTSEPVTRPWTDADLHMIGRFSVKATTNDSHVLSLARGHRSATLRDFLLWKAKGVAKTAGGQNWIRARKFFFASVRSRSK